MAVVTLVYVPFAAWVARKQVTGAVWGRALLAVVAFLIWSLTVPESGWHEFEAVAKNPGWVALIATLAGLFFGVLAERITPTS
ncbi:MAG TPA: hypothetical protein VFA08_07760 [Actinomycetota bacterium]|jgi:membrane associated rhomboid family serine protease|nr:hypothetical protein [Actinomycetota bacterium]